MTKKAESQCVVSAADYRQYWERPNLLHIEMHQIFTVPKYSGPERRANAHDRRFYNGQGGRRILDRKS